MLLSTVVLIILLLLLVVMAILISAILATRKNTNDVQKENEITDRDILLLIDQQSDGLMSPHQLRDLTNLTLNQARGRLSKLKSQVILKSHYNKSGRLYYELAQPIVQIPKVTLSSDPFITIEDLIKLIRAHEGRVTLQDLILVTNLPLKVIGREMRYFESENVVQRLISSSAHTGAITERFYVLKGEYRDNPQSYRPQAKNLDLNLQELLRSKNLID